MAKENMNKTYVFYMNSGYVGGQAEEEVASEDIGITEETTLKKDIELLEDYFQEFLGNLDSGYYEKD